MSNKHVHPQISDEQRRSMNLIEGLVDFRRILQERHAADLEYFQNRTREIEEEAERLGVDITQIKEKTQLIDDAYKATYQLATQQFQKRVREDQMAGN